MSPHNQHRDILDGIHDGILVFDRRWRCVYINPAGATFLRTTPEELIGHVLWEVFPEVRSTPFYDEFVSAAESRSFVQFEAFYPPLERWYECRCHPRHEGLTVLFSDTTESRQAAQTLQRYRLLAEHSRDIILFVSRDDGRIVEANAAALSAYRCTREQLLGRTIFDLRAAETNHRTAEQMMRADVEGILFETVHRRCDGTTFPVEVSSRGADIEDQRVLLSIIRDITAKKQAQEQLEELNRRLEQRVAERTAQLSETLERLRRMSLQLSQAEERERRRLAEILHDDLQQLLVGAKFHLDILNHRAVKGDYCEDTAAQIRELLIESIAKSRGLSHELSPPVLHQGRLADALQWLADRKQSRLGVTVHVDAEDVEPRSEAIKSFLYKAAREMLFNIAKHARVGEADLTLRRTAEGEIQLVVSDRGQGFDPEQEHRGFGLFSIEERVALLGGRLEVESRPGEGSTFSLVVPDVEDKVARAHRRRIEQIEAAAVRGEGPTRVCSRRVCVLIADDHEVMRDGLVSLLSEQEDLEIVGEASNGREAVTLTRQLRPDVVVMDTAMPIMSGEEATRQIKRMCPQTRIVALSMFEKTETEDRMTRAGADSFVSKTAASEELIAAIRAVSSDRPSNESRPRTGNA